MKKKIVLILSTNFAGSHFLSLLLGSHSRALHAGELFQLGRPPKKRNLGEVTLKEDRIFADITPDNIQQVYDIIFPRLDPKVEVLVDTSKVVRGWADQFVADDTYDRYYIHLIRDPRALVRRWLRRGGWKRELHYRWKALRSWPELRPFAEWADTPTLWLYRWLLENRRITSFIQQHQLNSRLVTYRDLATDTEAELRRLMEWVGLAFEPAQLEYWNREHIGTEKRNYEWVKEQKSKYFDLRWQQDLPVKVQQKISDDSLVKQYLTELGLSMVADGLTRQERTTP